MKKQNFNEIDEYIKLLGYELINVDYIGGSAVITFKDNKNYLYTTKFYNIKKGHKPAFIHPSNKNSIYNIKQWLINNNYNYELISDNFEGEYKKLIFKDFEGYYYFMSLVNLKKRENHLRFYKNNPYTIQNIKLWCKLNNKPFELLSEKFDGSGENLKWRCLKENCNEEFEMNWILIYNMGCGCPYCAGFRVGLSNCLAIKNPKLIKEWHPTLNGDLTPYDVTWASGKEVWWLCPDCEHSWPARISHRKNGTGCPECNKSKGEKFINDYLNNNIFMNILQKDYNELNVVDKVKNKYFINQMEYNDLIGLGGGLLPYDFYLPRYNLLIEYDGEYHYKPIRKYKNEPIKYAEERFKRQQEHDRLKNEYAHKHNIKLLRIPYWDFDNIANILEKELNKN